MAELPRTPPRWADQAAVSKLIIAVLDIRDYYDTNFNSIVCDDSPIPFLRPLSESDLEALERNYVRLPGAETLSRCWSIFFTATVRLATRPGN